jgi:hypothetical protein
MEMKIAHKNESANPKSVNYNELWNHYLKCCKVMDRDPDMTYQQFVNITSPKQASDMIRYFNL